MIRCAQTINYKIRGFGTSTVLNTPQHRRLFEILLFENEKKLRCCLADSSAGEGGDEGYCRRPASSGSASPEARVRCVQFGVGQLFSIAGGWEKWGKVMKNEVVVQSFGRRKEG